MCHLLKIIHIFLDDHIPGKVIKDKLSSCQSHCFCLLGVFQVEISNAKRNGIKNVYFYNADAGEFLSAMADEGETVDVVLMDPPRAGSDEQFLTSLAGLAPKKIVYISCNPETLQRDLQFLVRAGYHVQEIQPVDMFPHTNHVETVCLLSRKAQ